MTLKRMTLRIYELPVSCDLYCNYCDTMLNKRNQTIDHFLPKHRGGRRLGSNRVSCCEVCNQLKGGKVFNNIPAVREFIANNSEKWNEYHANLYDRPSKHPEGFILPKKRSKPVKPTSPAWGLD